MVALGGNVAALSGTRVRASIDGNSMNSKMTAASLAFALTVAGSGSMPAFAQTPDSSSTAARSVVAGANTSELVEAIYFGQGAAADELMQVPAFRYLSELKPHPLDDSQRATIAGVIESMRVADPIAFDAAAGRLRSGDPYVVTEQLTQLNDLLQDALAAAADERVADPLSDDSTISSPLVVIVAVFHAAVVVTGVAIAVVAVAVAGAVVKNADIDLPEGSASGGQERFLADITQALAR